MVSKNNFGVFNFSIFLKSGGRMKPISSGATGPNVLKISGMVDNRCVSVFVKENINIFDTVVPKKMFEFGQFLALKIS